VAISLSIFKAGWPAWTVPGQKAAPATRKRAAKLQKKFLNAVKVDKTGIQGLPMPKRPVQTPITDQEIVFAHLVLAGTMTDRAAAKAVGIDPSRAAYVKAKPKVQAYMEQHRASVRAGLVQHEVEALAKFNIGREQILAKWWELPTSIRPKGTTRRVRVGRRNCYGRA
jgi:hypothetical protein